MELNITHWITSYDMADFSNSIANSGLKNIGRITWCNACKAVLDGYKSKDSSQVIISNSTVRKECVDYLSNFGAWSRSELNRMSNIYLSAIILQSIAADCIMYSEILEDYETIGLDGDDHEDLSTFPITINDDGEYYFYVGV